MVQDNTPERTYKCVCDQCGEKFNSAKLIEVEGYPEYPGASTWKELVSPCCLSDYSEN